MRDRIKKLKGKSSHQTVDNILLVMEKYGWTIEQMKKCPIPTYLQILDSIKRKKTPQGQDGQKI